MKKLFVTAVLAAGTCLATVPAFADAILAPTVERLSPDALSVRWQSADPVEVLATDSFDAPIASARVLAAASKNGHVEVPVAAHARPFFFLRDTRTGEAVRVAERVLQLDQGTNFRDLGGYSTADGKHVRWGMLYRSGGQAMLTDADVAEIRKLGVANLVDLRSNEERTLAPTRLDGIRYQAIGYSMGVLQTGPAQLEAVKTDPGAVLASAYRKIPDVMIPHLSLVFRTMLANDGPLAYNCSAGQDRTGLVSAMILTALGVPREQVYADYVLTTKARRPAWELPPISAEEAQRNPTAAMWRTVQNDPAFAKPIPLIGADGTPYISIALGEIESKWGSTDAYLEQAIGLSKADIAKLRKDYLT